MSPFGWLRDQNRRLGEWLGQRPPDHSIRNSYFGFLIGTLDRPGKKPSPPEDDRLEGS